MDEQEKIMLSIIAQFSKHTGPLASGEHRITFDIQRELASELYPILQKLENYPQVVLHLELIGEAKPKEENLWDRQNKKIHALIDDIAVLRKMKSSDMKVAIKNELIKKGAIKESLKELNESQQAELLNILEEDLIDAKFND